MSARISTWGARHAQALWSTLGDLGHHGVASLLTVLAIALALALPLALNVLVDNVHGVSGQLSQSLALSVYLKPQLPDAGIRQALSAAQRLPGVASVTLISAAQGLSWLRQQAGLGEALDTLTDNPLPDLLQVRPSPQADSPAQLEQLRAALARLPQVDTVQFDRDWAVRFNALVELARKLLRISTVLLGAGVIAMIGNTIRLEIQGRWEEIEVTKLVGGSDGFVRRPFLYAGVLYGLAAAALAAALVEVASRVLTPAVAQLAAAYGSHFQLQGPGARELGLLLAVGAGLGWLGAAIEAARQLSRIQPGPD